MSVNDQESDPQNAIASPGQMLAEARERAGLSHEYVANALHMTVTKVKAIEQDEYNKLNVETYIRGYLRSYAGLVKIDSAPVLAAYEAQVASGGRVVPRADYVVRTPAARKGFGFILLIVGLLALLLLISVWFLGNRIPSEPVLPPVATLSENRPAPGGVVHPAEEAPTEESAAEEPAQTQEVAETADQTPGSSSAPSLAAPQATEVQSASVSELDHLYLVFSDECWLEVSDAQGDVLATNLQPAGSRLALLGQAPFKIKLGKYSHASITLNNQPVEILPPADVQDVYSFTLGE